MSAGSGSQGRAPGWKRAGTQGSSCCELPDREMAPSGKAAGTLDHLAIAPTLRKAALSSPSTALPLALSSSASD